MIDRLTSAPEAQGDLGPFVLRWTGATFAGWTLGFALVLLLLALVGLLGVGDSQAPVGLGMGAGVGLLQARLAGARIGGGRSWTAASTAGMGAPFVAFDLAGAAAFPLPFSLPFYVVLGGLVVGLLQWRILRRIFGGSGWWVIATPLGWTLAGSTVVLNDRFLPRIPGLGGALLYVAVVLAGGVALGLVGGLALHRIVGGRRRSPRGA